MNRRRVSSTISVAWREPTHRSLITESCRLREEGSLVEDLPTKGLVGAKTKYPQASSQSISDSEAAGHTDSLNTRGETVRLLDMRSASLRNENPAALADGSVKRPRSWPSSSCPRALSCGSGRCSGPGSRRNGRARAPPRPRSDPRCLSSRRLLAKASCRCGRAP